MSIIAMTLEMIVLITMESAMGQKFFGSITLSSLGISVRKVAFRVGRTFPKLRDSSTSCHTYSLSIDQQEWKKSMVKPFGPGALPVGMS